MKNNTLRKLNNKEINKLKSEEIIKFIENN